MKKKHEDKILLALAEEEQWAFGISKDFGRKWKAAYQEARRTHTILKAMEIATQLMTSK